MARSLKPFSFDPSEGFSEMVVGDSINRKASSTVRVVGRVFSTFGVETPLAGLEGITCSLTIYLKKDRSVEIFLAIELFLFFGGGSSNTFESPSDPLFPSLPFPWN
jgi:hypothetical protein